MADAGEAKTSAAATNSAATKMAAGADLNSPPRAVPTKGSLTPFIATSFLKVA
jgi:hypothetical protein